jgi:hypothetical protein
MWAKHHLNKHILLVCQQSASVMDVLCFLDPVP